jgi:hypothetical protein
LTNRHFSEKKMMNNNDAPVLQEAYQAYEESGGSMKALLLSLFSSGAFLYRAKYAACRKYSTSRIGIFIYEN